MLRELSKKIKRKALKLGYLACGIIPASDFPEYSESLDERVKSFPESAEFYKPLYEMAGRPEGAKSIVICTRRYNNYKIPDSLNGLIAKYYLFDGRINYSGDFRAKIEFEEYLKILNIKTLKCKIPDRLAAAKAGLGKIGLNNFLYDPKHGSYISIAAWTVDKELDYDSIAENVTMNVCGDGCRKCIKACPTNALSQRFSMNFGECITQLNSLTKNTLSDEKKAQLGLWLYGCDACQDACPLNKNKFTESQEYPLLNEIEEYLNPEKLLEMDEDTFLNIIYPRFWYIEKDGLWIWKCGALRYMINSAEEKYHKIIKEYAGHEDIRIRETAQWGCGRLGIL